MRQKIPLCGNPLKNFTPSSRLQPERLLMQGLIWSGDSAPEAQITVIHSKEVVR